jgi:RHS repeat-associated protein
VSFAAAPSWDTAGTGFRVALIDAYNGFEVPTWLVPISYGYDGSGGFTITYPNGDDYYNDYFSLAAPYTIAIYPENPAYPLTYLGGSPALDGATQLVLSPPVPSIAVGDTTIPILASISGTLTFPGGLPSGGVQAIAVPTTPDATGGQTDVLPDGSYHLVGLAEGSYNVGFIPSGEGPGPGAGIWWKTKPSLTGAGVVTLADGQQRAGINQSVPAGGVITGRLTDAQGNVVRGGVAIYIANGTSDSTQTLVQEKLVDADGTYTFWGLPNGKYRIGFNTGVFPTIISSLDLHNLDGSPYIHDSTSVEPDPGYEGATGADGRLATSTYPYVSAWYASSAATYDAAKKVTISASVSLVGNVDGVLPLDPDFLAMQELERISGSNPSEKDATCSCADPVDTLSGEYSEATDDLSLPGIGVPVRIDRSYSSALAGLDGPFGFGSSSALSVHLDEVDGAEDNVFGTVVVTQETGATVTFTALDGNRREYIAPSRVNATLRYDRPQHQWVFTRNDVEVLRFGLAGDLVSHSDLHGNLVGYGSDGSGHVTSIEGSGGRVIAIAWDGEHIVGATDSAGRSVAYSYSDGELTAFTAADGRVTSFGYDAEHRITTVTAPGGGVTTNVYDEAGRVTAQTDPVGRTTSFAYAGDPADSTTTVTDPAGVATVYHYVDGLLVSRTEAFGTGSAITTSVVYDAALNVITRVDARGKVTRMTYDDAGNMLTSTDPLGHTTTYQYDAIHDVISVTDPLGRVATATYDANGSKTSATSPSGAVTTWSFNPDGTQASSTDPLGNTASYQYSAAGQLTATTDPLGRTTTTEYDAAGHPVSTTDAVGATSRMTVDALGRPLTATDALGNVTEYGYDDFGNRTSVKDADGRVTTTAFDLANEPVSQTDALGSTTTVTYTPLGKVATSTNPLGGATTTGYDLLGRPITVTDPENLTTTTSYDKNSAVTKVRSPAGHVTKATYDAAGRQVTSRDPMGNVTAYAFDAADQLVSMTDPLGRVTTYAYDADGRPILETGPDGATESTAYDAAGHVTSYTDADGNVTSYTYDAAGQILTRTTPGGLVTSYTYTPAGQVGTVTKPDGTTIANVYSPVGRILSSTPSTGTPSEFAYDALGRRVTMQDASGITTYAYSAIGQLTSVTNGAGLTVGYGYDAAGRTTTLEYPGGRSVTYAYDADGRMTGLTDWADRTFAFTWTKDGLPARSTDPNRVVTTTKYDKNNLVVGITVAKKSKPVATLATYQYGYDAATQLTSTTLSDPMHSAPGGELTAYEYDQRHQLTTTSAGGSYGSTPAGSLVQTPASTLTYNSAQQLTAIVSPLSGVRTEFGYDGNGSRSTRSTMDAGGEASTTYDYTWQGDLSSVSTPTAEVGYVSDGDGLRQSRTTAEGTDRWLWDPATRLPLLLSDGDSNYLYGPTSTPLAQVDADDTIRYLHADNVGSVRLVTDASATVVGSADYSPYGAQTSIGAIGRWGYAGSWTDPVTGLDYLRARDYDPAVGQFIQVDPIQDSTRQPYAYVGNDPLGASDPSGLCNADTSVLTKMCQAAQYLGFFYSGLGPSVYSSVCGTTDAWTCANVKLNPMYAVIAGIDQCAHAADVYQCAVMTFNPVYHVIDAYGRLITDSENGCPFEVIAQDVLDAVNGVASTVAIAAGGANAGSAIKGVDWADETGSFSLSGNTRLTNAQAVDMAERLGYRPTNRRVRDQIVFTNGKTYIVQDTTSHSGGLWKMATSVERLSSKQTRMGTYDYNLDYVGP